ncbi:stalk domain-containing protein [Jeotgalibacillus sp. R-1-5s-1]|uniref:stalk domain-containing protein n=1 Tax=Jeotgalibacillus sp. R-1-5s-1 TaxID=2555897 RepID=UPI00141AEDF6|nr:stalk domain-containing protein [Jeotgalibacillus sp. R-1-5s-1]
MKWLLSLFVFLLLLSAGGLTYWQWKGYQEVHASEGITSLSQSIDLIKKPDSLIVEQTFHRVPDQLFTINWPETSTGRTCPMENCERISEDLLLLSEGNAGDITLSYTIPVNTGQPIILDDWVVTLESADIHFTTVSITDQLLSGGQWISSLPYKGAETLELIQYTAFEGRGNAGELVWLQTPLPIYQTRNMNIYSAQEPEVEERSDQLKDVYVTVVHSSELSGAKLDEILVLQDGYDPSSVTRFLYEKYVMDRYNVTQDQSFLIDMMISGIFGVDPLSDKGVQAIEVIQGELSGEEQLEWESWLLTIEETLIEPAIFDQKFSALTGEGTTFFTDNSSSAEFTPYYSIDSRVIEVNEEPVDGAVMIYRDGTTYYLLTPLLNALGYETEVNGDSAVSVIKDQNTYMFYMDQPSFTYNNEQLTLNSSPVISVKGDPYIQERWVQRLFLTSIDKNETILISQD